MGRQNKVTIQCWNFLSEDYGCVPDCCYTCLNRDGKPMNLGGDEGCSRFVSASELVCYSDEDSMFIRVRRKGK